MEYKNVDEYLHSKNYGYDYDDNYNDSDDNSIEKKFPERESYGDINEAQ